MRHVVVAGSTGLIGTEVVKQLGARADVRVTALVRKPSGRALAANVTEQVFDFAGNAPLPCDALLCCVGTTMKQAGSEAAFQKVERDIPLNLLSRLKAAGGGVYGLVSSAGAGKPFGFYLKNKAEVEAAVRASGVRHVIVRPSLLLGARAEFRPGERLAVLTVPPLMSAVSALTLRKLPAVGRMLPIQAAQVARTLIARAVDAPPKDGGVTLEGYELFA